MRKVILVGVLLAAVWYYFVGSRRLSEDAVNAFYQAQVSATLSRNPEALCNLLADDFEAKGTSVVYGQATAVTQDKQQSCEAYRAMYKSIEAIGARMGGIAQLDFDHRIESVELSRDRKRATVTTRYVLDVAGNVMHVRGRSTDVLIRRGGRVLLLHSDDKSSVSGG